MITKKGIKKTIPELVAYEEIQPGEDETTALARLTTIISSKGEKPRDPGMVMFVDDKNSPSCRKEVMIPVDRETPGLKTKIIPETRAGFLVFETSNNPIEYYYEELLKYIKAWGLKPKLNTFCTSIEAVFQPETFQYATMDFVEEDKPDTYEIEIIIPVED
jgi:effector-binding domain-containing protein